MDNNGFHPDLEMEPPQQPAQLKTKQEHSLEIPAVAIHGKPSEEECTLEDYSLISFLPNYKEHKRRFNELLEKRNLKKYYKPALGMLAVFVYLVYFIAVLSISSALDTDNYWCHGDGILILITILTSLGCLYYSVKHFFGQHIYESFLKPLKFKLDEVWRIKAVRYAACGVLGAALAIFLAVDTAGDRQRLMSVFGLVALVGFGFVFSAAPRAVVWRHVLWGLALQFVLGLVLLRWPVGIAVFRCLGDKVSAFLAFTDKGTGFVFGILPTTQITNGPIFAFYVLPVILFFSFCLQILYYLGVVQWVVLKLGWALQVTVGTTTCESVNAAANVFMGQTEAPLIIKPYLPLMTKSELHAMMTGGFATIAGAVMAAYISLGISGSHLITASVMSAPAALAYAKLFYPETEKTKTALKDMPTVKSEESNMLHAAIEGVTTAVPLVACICANLIAFIAFVAFFNGVFNWSCMLVAVEDGVCSFENVFGYVFMPLAWLMGVRWAEAHAVGSLIATKTIVNEFVAYAELTRMANAGELSPRSRIIATYALCGFSNIGSIGIQLGGIGAMAPSRRADASKVVVRAMIAGSAACFLTACVAGALLDDDAIDS